MTLTVVTVVLLGGVNIFGGSGTIPGVVLAVLVVAVMQNALRLASVSVEVQSIALGLLLILSVVIPTFAHQAKSAIDRVRGGRPPPADSVPRVSERCHSRGGTALKLRTFGRIALVSVAALVFAACSSSGGSAAPSAAASAAATTAASAAATTAHRRGRVRRLAAAGKPITIGYLPKDIVNQYFAAAKTGIDKAAGEPAAPSPRSDRTRPRPTCRSRSSRT